MLSLRECSSGETLLAVGNRLRISFGSWPVSLESCRGLDNRNHCIDGPENRENDPADDESDEEFLPAKIGPVRIYIVDDSEYGIG